MARSDKSEAMSYLVSHMTKVDRLYQRTNWSPDGSEDMSGYRLQIEAIKVHAESDNTT